VRPLVARAPGKVNLCLYVGRPRADGLHPLVSVVQPLSLADELRLSQTPGPGDAIVCPGVTGPNLAATAVAAYRGATGWDGPPVRLDIVKQVPVAAGMGGGSGDAAAALRLLAHAAGRADDPLLTELAPALGADVPAQIVPRRALVTGAGEVVEPLPEAAPRGFLILPSEHALSTADVYREADRLELGRAPKELAELEARVRAAPDEHAHNDLEAAARSLCPSIDDALAAVRAAGAAHAFVSGSGPTVVGFFPDLGAARAAAEGLPGAVAAEPVGPDFAAVREG
jgi:4-diphosphocytidyl-2-C-methyl-D-erythritol kinase